MQKKKTAVDWLAMGLGALTTSKCTNAKCKVQVATGLAPAEVCRAKLEVCRAELEVSGEYQKGWFT